jgi:hypothetical protein
LSSISREASTGDHDISAGAVDCSAENGTSTATAHRMRAPGTTRTAIGQEERVYRMHHTAQVINRSPTGRTTSASKKIAGRASAANRAVRDKLAIGQTHMS